MNEPAPIAVFAYNRPDHLSRVLTALAANPEAQASRVAIYCDAPKTSVAAADVAAVRAVARNVRGYLSVDIVEQPANKGVARSIIDGVGELVDRHGRVIVLEDDLLPAASFLRYMNDALARYAADDRVASIHAYAYPVREPLPETFFLRGADCWGWATWRRGWALFEPDGRVLLREIEHRGLAHAFDFDGAYPYTEMLRHSIAGRNDSWAVRWYASAFLRGKLTLYPGSSLVRNIGTDGSGLHVGNTRSFDNPEWGRPVAVRDIPVEESRTARAAFSAYLAGVRPSVRTRLLHGIRGLLRSRAN